MKNRQHEYILRAFVEAHIPVAIRKCAPELIAIDSILGGYCTQLINREKFIELQSGEFISKSEKAAFSKLINQSTGIEKNELVVYYRLAIFVEAVLIQYRK